MISELHEIRKWSTCLPYWEQAALDKVIGGVEITDEVSDAIGRLSRYFDAYSQSDLYVAQKPTVEMLEEEIMCFKELAQRHKQIRKDRKLDN